MRVSQIIRDKLVFLLCNAIAFGLVSIGIVVGGLNFRIIFMLFAVWFTPLLTYMATEGIRLKLYSDRVEKTLEELDCKYLLPEVLEDETSLTGKYINEVLSLISRDMHEEVKQYRDMQSDYREYIESWVHEIKTPIASAKLLIENDRNLTTEKIEGQLKKVEGYVQQVLYYSRSNSVSNDYMVKSFSLETLVRSVVRSNSRDFIGKRIKLRVGQVDKMVYSDSKWVEFILNQLVVNAIKYSKTKGARVDIYCEELSNAIRLTVKDNGVGISKKDLGRVFDKGFTGENGRKYGSSTGMGLYLSKKLCQKLGLAMDISSELGEGTEVSILFPIDKKRIETLN